MAPKKWPQWLPLVVNAKNKDMKMQRSKSPGKFQKVIKEMKKAGYSNKRAVGTAFGEADLAKKRDAKERAMYAKKKK